MHSTIRCSRMPAISCATGATARDTVLLTLSPVSHHIAWVAVAQWLIAGCSLVPTIRRPA